MPNELTTKTHMATQGASGKSSNRDALREGDEAAQHRKNHQCTLGTHERTGGSRLQALAQGSSVLRFCSRLSVLRVAGGGVVSFCVPSLFGRSSSR